MSIALTSTTGGRRTIREGPCVYRPYIYCRCRWETHYPKCSYIDYAHDM